MSEAWVVMVVAVIKALTKLMGLGLVVAVVAEVITITVLQDQMVKSQYTGKIDIF